MAYLLDTPVVSCVLQARRENELARAATIVGCAIADDVRAELAADPARGPVFQRWLPASHVEVLSIVVGSATDAVLTRLQTAMVTTRGRAARASIAIAASNPELVLVSMDRNAMWIALRELSTPGERLLALPVFLRRLVDAVAFSADAADDVMKQSQHVLPAWWAYWRATC